jgi:hypothetical protein
VKTKLTSAVAVESDNDYRSFEQFTSQRIAAAIGPLFETDASGLFEAYLAGIPAEYRQHYTCHACRRFIERYGGLVRLTEDGKPDPVLFNAGATIPPFFVPSVTVMEAKVRRAKVTGVYLDSAPVWGTPQTGDWSHLSGSPATPYRASALKNASQAMAEKREEYGMLCRGIADFPLEAVVQAVRVLEADVVDRSEKTLGVGQWFLKLHRDIEGIKGPARNNRIWLAVATAPTGWAHVRTTMIGTLLEDVILGMPFERIKERWASKMHPLQYQRPTAISDGQLKAANEAVAKLGSAGALQRRFARLSDVTALWKPRDVPPIEAPSGGGAFDHLLAKRSAIKEVELPPAKMGWEKFLATVLPTAFRLECYVPHSGGFFGLVTAANPDAPPILQWDGLDGHARNPVSWYFHHPVGQAYQWNLQGATWTTVTAVFLKPCYWQEPAKFGHQGRGVYFSLTGCKDMRNSVGGGFFPETLRSEYHGIRSAMEAYATSAAVAGCDEGDANGICLGEKMDLRVRVRNEKGSITEYQLTLD